ncbi:MAG: hypothetical protein P8Y46_00625 [Sulfurovaceae bacterium]
MRALEHKTLKDQFRKDCFERLKKASKLPNRYAKDKRLQRELLEYINHLNPKVVMLYIPMKIEFDISGTIKKLKQDCRLIYVPFIKTTLFIARYLCISEDIVTNAHDVSPDIIIA